MTRQTGAWSWQGLRSLAERARLAWRLFRDPRVPLWTKAIPVAALLYLVWPLDIITDLVPGLGQLDDITLLLVAAEAFVRLSPRRLWASSNEAEPSDADDIIEGAFHRVDDPALEDASPNDRVGTGAPS